MQANFNGTEFDNLYISKPLVKQVQSLQQQVVTNNQAIQQLDSEIEEFTNENINLTLDSMKYQFLYNEVITKLNPFMDLYRDASFSSLNNELTNDIIKKFSYDIENYIYNGDKILQEKSLYDISMNGLVPTRVYNHNEETFFNYRKNIHKMINGLVRSMIEYNNYTSEKTICDNRINVLEEKNEEYEEILSSTTNVLEYFKKRSQIDADTDNISLQATIFLKPQIRLYFERHGMPKDGLFKSELMGPIIQELVANGLLEPIE